ncbi:SDR family oxidoreductase [Actinomycetospora sp. NBRC 106378]|uniref:SDR family oxidoreductase n=1 Tax=Actinomycetospora sp. NBRC 106378 TaxID=3032208 RepID=UPI00249FDF90|nr:SDR family oxidoreductase [Actinomycetospora sp. NBRC 106378]GLZ51595.1 oxidoreductase [Actinomycetospora sp. NBRC 106378]
MGALDGTVAAVTGASSGIGEATARALAAQGATLALLARRADRLEALAADLGGHTSVHAVDLADTDAAVAAIGEVVARHGRLDVLVNNAGYGSLAPARGSDLADWRATTAINLDGLLAASHAALEPLVAAAGGPRGVADLVNVSSDAGRRVLPVGAVYSATKHAVGAFSESLRQELAPVHVRVGVVEPGITRTELPDKGEGDTPDLDSLGELGVLEAADIADAVVWMVTRPARVAVNEILVRPAEQT